jgi:A/G-specific adenine glycosylase
LRQTCIAAQHGLQHRYPVKTRKLKRSQRSSHWLCLAWRDRMWLVQRPAEGIWAGLWTPCEFDSAADLASSSAGWPGSGLALPPFKHVLTHLDWQLFPVRYHLPDSLDAAQVTEITGQTPGSASGRWFDRAEVPSLGLPAALRKILPAL